MRDEAKTEQLDRDAAELAKLGYAQQLLREMGGFSNFALSFSIISILTGAVTLYGHGLRFGGPFVMSVGWVLVTVMTLPVAASLAELASAYPTAGALYHWSSILGGRAWGFFTAYLNTIGQFAITAGIDYGLAEFLAAMLGLGTDRIRILGIYAVVLASHAVLNHIGVRAVAILNSLSAWYHMVGVALLVGALIAFAPKQPASFLLERITTEHRPYAYAFLIGLLQAQWTYTGYDASAHVTEETVDPARNAPWGIVLSVAVSGVVGWVMLLAITLAIPDLASITASDNPFIAILERSLPQALGRALVWLVIGAMWFCGLSSVTSNSRMLFAFARDGGLPASRQIARVSERFRTPHVAIWVSALAAFAVALWATAYSAMVALSTIALYASYGMPIAAYVLVRRAERRMRSPGAHAYRDPREQPWPRRGPWNLGRFSDVVHALALVWVVVVLVLFVLPPNELAGYTFAGSTALLAAYWFAVMRKRFAGPRIGVQAPAAETANEGLARG